MKMIRHTRRCVVSRFKLSQCCCFQSNYAKHDESRARRAYVFALSSNSCIYTFIHIIKVDTPHTNNATRRFVFKESAARRGWRVWLIISHLVISLSDSSHHHLNYDKATLGRIQPFFIYILTHAALKTIMSLLYCIFLVLFAYCSLSVSQPIDGFAIIAIRPKAMCTGCILISARGRMPNIYCSHLKCGLLPKK